MAVLYQQEVADRQVMAVPMVFLNGEHFGQGRMDVRRDRRQARRRCRAARDAAQAERRRMPYDVLIVGGGGPAGAAAAVYAGAQRQFRTGHPGGTLRAARPMDTMSIENFISVLETDGPKFAAALEQHAKQLRRRHPQFAARGTTSSRPSAPGGLVGVTLAERRQACRARR